GRTVAPAHLVRQCRANNQAWSDRPSGGLPLLSPLAEPVRQPSTNWRAPPIAGVVIPLAANAVRGPPAVECQAAEPGGWHSLTGNQRQCVLQVRQALFAGHIRTAEPLTAPISDWVKRRALQELRTTKFSPGMRRFAQFRMKFLDQAGFP